MKLIVGLGNPGPQYAGTRHNVGFDLVDLLAARLGWIARPEKFDPLSRTNFDGLALDGILNRLGGNDEKVLLLKPMTFMNLSGKSVSAAMSFYHLAPSDVLVVLDDLALPCGKIRLRAGGSSGGHNGLKDIQRAIGTDQYPRLRIGIDPTPPRVAGADYVLGKFTVEQRSRLEPAIERSAGAAVTWADLGVTAAMTQFNGDTN